MKSRLIRFSLCGTRVFFCVTLFLCAFPLLLVAQEAQGPLFADHFIDSTLRVDYYHIGDKNEELITLDRLILEGRWAGNPVTLVNGPDQGRYRAQLHDSTGGHLLFSRCFDSYFGEYKTTEAAGKGIKRTYQESVLLPLPRRPVRLSIEVRDKVQKFHQVFFTLIDPADYHIIRETPRRPGMVIDVVTSGDPHSKVDLVIVGDGYTAEEQAKFESDVKKYAGIFFSWEPYKSRRGMFNIRGIFAPSTESGVDEPRQGRYRRTVLNSTFNSLDSDRYLLTEETRLLRDLAGQVPYDAMLVMVNSKRYGGGGIYNAFTVFTSEGPWNEHVFQHEFAHAFAGLADEYYTTDVAYDQFYPQGLEPLEPNITALLDPANLKWRSLVSPGLEVPTEWGQATYDSLTAARDSLVVRHQTETLKLRRTGASESAMKKLEAEYQANIKEQNNRVRTFIEDHPLRGKIGAFQGAGYAQKGLYRPTVNSLMNQFNDRERTFYRVNEEVIIRTIRWYCE